MFRPNTTALLYSRSSTQDVFAQYTYAAPISVPCALIKVDIKVAKTSVRADSSASRGRAEEQIGLSRILFPPTVVIKDGDMIVIDNLALEVMRLFYRHDVLGNIDHIEVDLRKGAVP